jgi:hypothetical protein
VPFLLTTSRAVGRVPLVGRAARRMIPVANYDGVLPLSDEALLEWAKLDTFDWLSPRYDSPQRPSRLRRLLEEAGLEHVEVLKPSLGHLTGRGRRPGASLC